MLNRQWCTNFFLSNNSFDFSCDAYDPDQIRDSWLACAPTGACCPWAFNQLVHMMEPTHLMGMGGCSYRIRWPTEALGRVTLAVFCCQLHSYSKCSIHRPLWVACCDQLSNKGGCGMICMDLLSHRVPLYLQHKLFCNTSYSAFGYSCCTCQCAATCPSGCCSSREACSTCSKLGKRWHVLQLHKLMSLPLGQDGVIHHCRWMRFWAL